MVDIWDESAAEYWEPPRHYIAVLSLREQKNTNLILSYLNADQDYMKWKGTASLCHLQLIETMFHGDYKHSKQTLTTKIKIYILVLSY